MKSTRSYRFKNSHNRLGFTLLEVMITVAIIGILAAMAYTNYIDQMPKIRTKDAVRQLWSDIYTARSQAAKEKTDTVIIFDTTNNSYSVVLDVGHNLAPTDPINAAEDKYIIQDRELGERIIFVTGLTGVNDIDGNALVSGVVLDNNRVYIQPSGRSTNSLGDEIGNLLPDARRSIYIMHSQDAKNWKDAVFGLQIEPISTIPSIFKYDYGQAKWVGKEEDKR